MIIGQDMHQLIHPMDNKQGKENEPWAVRTHFGWTVIGPFPKKLAQSINVSSNLVHITDLLSEQVKRWWGIEAYSSNVKSSGKSLEEKKALEILERTTRFNSDRYEVGMLWKNPDHELPNKYPSALSQFKSLERRLARDEQLRQRYDETIRIDADKSFIRKLDTEELRRTKDLQQWYLPHHPVLNPHKPDKVRRVCNAASKFRGTSLNDKLVPGPDLLRSLLGIIFRFRENKIAMTADIESMFLQVAVPKEECRYLRFLWRSDPNNDIDVYEYNRHVFGARSSPICVNYALQQSATDQKDAFPEMVRIVDRNFYMDDFIKSLSSTAKAKKNL